MQLCYRGFMEAPPVLLPSLMSPVAAVFRNFTISSWFMFLSCFDLPFQDDLTRGLAARRDHAPHGESSSPIARRR